MACHTHHLSKSKQTRPGF